MKLKSLVVTLVVPLAVGLGGCTGGDGTGDTDRTFKDVLALRDAAVDAGYPCPEWHAADKRPGLSGHCSRHDVLNVYRDQKERDRLLAEHEEILRVVGYGATILVGANWSIEGPFDDIRRLMGRLGGEIRTVEVYS